MKTPFVRNTQNFRYATIDLYSLTAVYTSTSSTTIVTVPAEDPPGYEI